LLHDSLWIERVYRLYMRLARVCAPPGQ
jgi:hypothetical protein